MRRAARVDANQQEIVTCLRLVGYSVAHTHTVAAGFPDLVLGRYGRTWLAEIKRDEKATYTPDQLAWRENWQGAPPLRFNSAGEAMAWAAEQERLYGPNAKQEQA